MSVPATNIATLDDLATELEQAKQNESGARARRLEIEESILSHPAMAPLPDEGTTHCGPFKIVTRHTRKWGQEELAALHQEIDDAYWPFRTEWKEDRKAVSVLSGRFPDLWERIHHALTLTPSKPTITIK